VTAAPQTDLHAPAPESTGGTGAAAAALVPRRRRLLLALSVLGLLLMAALIALGLQLRSYDRVDDQREAAVQAAQQSALNLTSIDNEDFKADVDRVLAGATGSFKTDFEARSKELAQVLAQNEVASEGKVIDAGLVRFDDRNATALVVVDSNVKNTAVPEGRVNTYRMRLTLERQGDAWLTSMLEFVG
jgi:Mce-associated membrane protein